MDKQEADQVSAINQIWEEVNRIFGFTGGEKTHGDSSISDRKERIGEDVQLEKLQS